MKKKQKTNIQFSKNFAVLLALFIFLLTVAQAISAYYILQNREYMIEDSERTLTGFVNSTEEKRYSHPVIDVTEGRVYVPEARIYLPLNETTRNLRYDYRNPFDTVELYLSVRGVVGNQQPTDDPQCDKMIWLSQKKNNSPNFVAEIEPTKDGLRYVSAHDTCEIYYDTVRDDLLEAVKQLKNY